MTTSHSHWAPGFGDHTSGDGLMAIYNASLYSHHKAWAQSVSLVAGETYTFDGWVASLTQSIVANADPIIDLRVNNVSVGTFHAAGIDDVWQNFNFSWTSSIDGVAEIAIHDLRSVSNGDDFALDDLSLVGASAIPIPNTFFLLLTGMIIVVRLNKS